MKRAFYGDLFRFLIVGSIGFVVDAGLMALFFYTAEWSPVAARSVSFPVAFTCTWLFNRNWTFSEGQIRSAHSQYILYLGIQLLGLAINLGLFALLLGVDPFWANRPVLTLAVGAAAALVVTFALSRSVVFASPKC